MMRHWSDQNQKRRDLPLRRMRRDVAGDGSGSGTIAFAGETCQSIAVTSARPKHSSGAGAAHRATNAMSLENYGGSHPHHTHSRRRIEGSPASVASRNSDRGHAEAARRSRVASWQQSSAPNQKRAAPGRSNISARSNRTDSGSAHSVLDEQNADIIRSPPSRASNHQASKLIDPSTTSHVSGPARCGS